MDEDRYARIGLTSALGHFLGLNFDAQCELLEKFKSIESNRELLKSLPEILEEYF
jgi:hypothetical protein